MRQAAFAFAGICLLVAGAWSWVARTRPEPLPRDGSSLEIAVFAGGCYWCMEPAFDRLPGVVHVRAGYAGEGEERREAVEIRFDPAQTSYEALLGEFWRNVDPVDDRGQFCDAGHEYSSAIFPRNDRQARLAAESKLAIRVRLGAAPLTGIVMSEAFDPVGEYDQNYYRKHPVRYAFYRLNCGRDARLASVWGRR